MPTNGAVETDRIVLRMVFGCRALILSLQNGEKGFGKETANWRIGRWEKAHTV